METDADRLASIKGLGGQLVRADSRSFWAIFDNESSLTADGVVESRTPVLAARSIDVELLTKDVVVEVGARPYRIKRIEPDGTGMTVLVLRG